MRDTEREREGLLLKAEALCLTVRPIEVRNIDRRPGITGKDMLALMSLEALL